MNVAIDNQSIDARQARVGQTPWPWHELSGLAGIVALFLVLGLLLILEGVPLGHDEAVYSVRAREFLSWEGPSGWWSPNRAPGLPIVLTVAWLGSGTEPYLRLVVLLFGVVLVIVTWLLARLLVGTQAALIAALGTALTPFVVMSATNVWPDIPGAAVGATSLYLYARELSRDRFRWRIVAAVVVVTAFATVIRFGAPIPIAAGLVGLTLWRWPATRRRKAMVAVTAVGVACAVVLILATPLLTNSRTPLEGVSGRSEFNPFLGGFLDYWGLRGRIVEGAVYVGILGLAIGLGGSVIDQRYRQLFLWPIAVALLTFVALATFVHGEVRYLSPVVPWFWMSSAVGLVYLAERVPKSPLSVTGALVVVVLIILTPRWANDGILANDGFQTLKTAATTLQGQEQCGVLTSYTPQVEWYSGCETEEISTIDVNVDTPDLPEGPRYVLIVENGKRQPSADLFELYAAHTTGEPRVFGPTKTAPRSVEIWRVEDT